MKFVDKLLGLMMDGFFKVISIIYSFMEFLAKPLSYLFEFLKGIFYFIFKIFDVVVQVVMIFVALFQFLGAIIAGVFRMIKSWLIINPDANDVSFPSTSYQGFKVVTDLLQPTGLMTVVPAVALAFLWFYFILKMIGLFGGSIMISPMGRGGDK